MTLINTTIKNFEGGNNLAFFRASNHSQIKIESVLFENNTFPLINSEGGVINIAKSIFRNNDIKGAAFIWIRNDAFNPATSSVYLSSLEVYENHIGVFLEGEGIDQILASKVDFFKNTPNQTNLGGGFLQVSNFNLTHLTSCNFYALKLMNIGLIETTIQSREGEKLY